MGREVALGNDFFTWRGKLLWGGNLLWGEKLHWGGNLKLLWTGICSEEESCSGAGICSGERICSGAGIWREFEVALGGNLLDDESCSGERNLLWGGNLLWGMIFLL